jgi:cytochrome c oxidase cbb3-type subunit 2
MTEGPKTEHRWEWSAILTVLGVLALFSTAIIVILWAPEHIDPSWKQASSPYQAQMYEISDPRVYMSTSSPRRWGLQTVYHMQEGLTLSLFQESELFRIMASEDLQPYITRWNDSKLKLTSRVLFLRKPQNSQLLEVFRDHLKKEWRKERKEDPPFFEIFELSEPQKSEGFAVAESDGITEHWAEKDSFRILDQLPSYDASQGTIYIRNPQEYRVSPINYLGREYWIYQENGDTISSLKELEEGKLRFLSRKKLIELGEDLYRIEGCWYCHTDQTRTLVQDLVLNGSAAFPAPPSSANEYIFQRVTFPGTRRIGPDLSRVGVKKANRDWHLSHFWSPKTESAGTIMPSFKHFFDYDPAGTEKNPYGIPNYKFEAIYQYLMTKGTRITSPDQAWWLGKDPIQALTIIEGKTSDDSR